LLDDKDIAIVGALRKNSRQKLTDISKSTGIPTSTVHERVKRFVKQGMRLVTLLNYPHIQLPLHCWVLIKSNKRAELKAFLQAHTHVNTLLIVNNGVDVVAECVFANIKQQHMFLEQLSEYGKATAHPVIEEIGREVANISQLTAHRNI